MPPTKSEPGQARDIESLRREYADLHAERITAEANLKNANDALEVLRVEAKATYGTDDLDELRAKLRQMQADNEKKRADYQVHLDKVKEDLRAVEAKFSKK